MSIESLTEMFYKSVDKMTNNLTVMTADHRYIHEGLAFTFPSDTGAINASAAYSLSLITPADSVKKYVHFRPLNYATTANITSISIREDDTATGGSIATAINRNRNSKNTSKAVLTYGVTAGGAGTLVFLDVVGAGSSVQTRTGGSAGAGEEIVFKPNTKYTITFTNIGSSTATTVYYNFMWYEEEKKLSDHIQ